MARGPSRSPDSAVFAEEFGRRVRLIREGLDPFVSQETLANRAGVHRTYVSHLEMGKGSPTLDTIINVARALQVDPAQLVSGLQWLGTWST